MNLAKYDPNRNITKIANVILAQADERVRRLFNTCSGSMKDSRIRAVAIF
jgi:hypothetical protein